MQNHFVCLNESDNVAVALERMPRGRTIMINGHEVIVQETIEFGHKFAIQLINQGDFIVKYGETIGTATSCIKCGEHVHLHNVEGNRGRGDDQ